MWRKGIAAVALLLMLSLVADAVPRYAFRIVFRDKNNEHSVREASSFLSSRALERRAQNNIAFDEKDLPVSKEYLTRVLALTQGSLHLTSKWLNSCVIWLEDSSRILSVAEEPYIASVAYVGYKNEEHKGAAKTLLVHSSGAKYKTTGNAAFYGSSWTQTDFVKGECLHDKGIRGQGKFIAILDDGFHYVNTNPAFDSVFSSGRILDTRNFVQGNTDVYSDFLFHGTVTFSTMAVNMPNIYVGAAPEASYALFVTEDASSETPVEMDNMVAAFERADSLGVDVVSVSLGYNTFDPPFPSLTPADMDGKTTVAAIGANIAAQKGMLMVITAGNEGNWGLLTPGDADSALTVGNVDVNKTPAGSSSYGPNASGTVKPEVCALGQPGFVVTSSQSPFGASGTSISTPQVAGWAACLWQASTGKTNVQIKRAIVESSHLFPSYQLPQLGYGVPDFCQADITLSAEPIEKNVSLEVYPNPFVRELFLKVDLKESANVSIVISDVAGREILSWDEMLDAGLHRLPLEVPQSLTEGIYFARIFAGRELRTIKLFKR